MKQARLLSEDEKRRYFRIDDVAIIKHRQVTDEHISSEAYRHEQARLNKLTLKARFETMTREMKPLLKMIDKSNSRIARYLESLDNKLNLLSEYVIECAMEDMAIEPQHINIGAGGVSFTSETPIMIGATLELRMVMLPENTGIFTYARVVTCNRLEQVSEDGHQYRVALEFVSMEDDVRDLITRHVLAKEQVRLREENHAHRESADENKKG